MRRVAAVTAGRGTTRRALPVLPFGEWRPDLPEFGNPGAVNVSNVIPYGPTSYKPFPDFSAGSTTPLAAQCLGAASIGSRPGDVYQYAGDSTDLYFLLGNVWTSGGSGFSLNTDERWEFVRVPEANTVIATSISEITQVATLGGVTFSDFYTSTLKPQARHAAAVGSFLMLLNVREGGVDYTDRVRWSSISDPADMDQSAANQSDSEDLSGGYGWGQKIVGYGRTATIFMERAIFRAQYVGSPTVFRFDVVEPHRGTLSPGSVIPLGRYIFYLAPDGFFVHDGLESHPIGHNKIDKYFFDNVDTEAYQMISGAVDMSRQVVMWAYPTSSATAGTTDRILLYHWPSGWWGEATVTLELLIWGLSQGLNLEQLDTINTSIDALPYSLDSKYWMGGRQQVRAFNTAHNSGTFTGANLAATIDTGVRQISPGKQTMVTGARPVVDGGTLTAAVAGVQRMNDTLTFGSNVDQNDFGVCPVRNKARYQKFRVNVAAGGTWTHAQGLEVIGSDGGMK